MLDQLRIKCPSCGIILDVKNSKHEALKQIVCPNCKKQLAVNFEEELEPVAPPQPIEPLYYGEMRIDLQEGDNKIALPDCDKAEIKVVRLKDGNSKCMVRPLSDTIPVKVNRQQLQLDEQVVLSKGDYLEIGRTCLRSGESGSINLSSIESPDDSETPTSTKPRRKRERNYIWLYTVLAFVVLMGATIYLWPKEPGHVDPQPGGLLAQDTDTMVKNPQKEVITTPKDTVKPPVTPPKTPPKEIGLKALSDFELEKKALGGSVEAQFELGNRLVHRTGQNNIIRGLKYLKMAAQNGSSEARTKMNQAINALRERAENGDSISYYILKSI